MSQLPAEIEALVLAELGKRVKARTETTKALFGQRYPDGHRETFRSPLDGSKLGIVYRTDPDPQWKVTDREALHAHLREYRGNVETVYEIADDLAAIDVLREHAPHLLVEITRVIPDVVEAALDQSRATGEPAAPGIELVKPSGSLTVKPDPKAGGAVERLVEAGVITWDGRPVLETGQEAS
jgi:hypothetical protein